MAAGPRNEVPLVLLGTMLAAGGVVAVQAQRVEQRMTGAAATEDDRVRLRGWRTAWIKGLTQARAGGAASDIAALGQLADPDYSLADPQLPRAIIAVARSSWAPRDVRH